MTAAPAAGDRAAGADAQAALALARPAIRSLRAYDPGHDLEALRAGAAGPLAELGSNENPDGPSPRARAAAVAALDALHRYPDPRGGRLKAALAATHGVTPAQLVLGNGSHELLMQLAQVFAGEGDEVVVPEYGFAVFRIAAAAVGATIRTAPATPEDDAMPRGHDPATLLAAVTPRTRLLYLANPNNPTGTWLAADALAALVAAVPPHVVVVIDEAYAELATAPGYASALPLLAAHPNLVVTRTFSKAYGLAGLRIGYAIATPGLAAVLERVRESFNVGVVALAAAEAALGDDAHLAAGVSRNARARDALALALRARGLRVSPSQANFLLVDVGADARSLEAALLSRGVVLRPMDGYGLPHCLRISVGGDADNARLLAALDAVRT